MPITGAGVADRPVAKTLMGPVAPICTSVARADLPIVVVLAWTRTGRFGTNDPEIVSSRAAGMRRNPTVALQRSLQDRPKPSKGKSWPESV